MPRHGLVGSQARGEATEDSDVDLVLLFVDPEARLADRAWVADLGEPVGGAPEDYGAVQSLRAHSAQTELELAVTGIHWARLAHSDPGTRAAVERGLVAWFDPRNLFAQ